MKLAEFCGQFEHQECSEPPAAASDFQTDTGVPVLLVNKLPSHAIALASLGVPCDTIRQFGYPRLMAARRSQTSLAHSEASF